MWTRFALRTILAVIVGLALGTCGGSSPSAPTPPTPCAYTVAPATEISLLAAGGVVSLTVTTTTNCSWTASADRDWIVVSSGATGAGPGPVTVTVALNPGATERTGTLTVAGQTRTVRQDGTLPCAWTLVPDNVRVSSDSRTGSFEIHTAATCPWSAASNVSWLAIRSSAQGTGNGTITYEIERNPDTADRSGRIRVGDLDFVVTQSGDASACQYSVGPVAFDPCMTAPQMTATITTTEACTWTATADASWISVTGGDSGSGSGTVTFRVADNWAPPRTGLVMVRWPTVTAGQNLRVVQAGCYYAVNTTAINITRAGGPGRFDVIQQSDPITCGGPLQNACVWTATSDASWISITTSMPQSGDNPVSFSVEANPGTTARTGTITVRDKVVQIIQAGGTP